MKDNKKSPTLRHSSKKKKGFKLHIGCGDRRYNGFINCDIRKTKATDQVFDCSNLSRFPDKSADVIFSHAFFEHLGIRKAYTFLEGCRRVISDDGYVLIFGIPDFDRIADAYLKRKLITRNPDQVFDIYHVYRLTHGDSDGIKDEPVWQIHKSVYNKEVLFSNVKRAGFKNCIIFNYTFKGELLPMNIGIIATNKDTFVAKEIKKAVAPFRGYMNDYHKFIKEIEKAGK